MISDLPDFARYPWIAADVESTGLRWWKDRAFSISFCTPDQRSFYFDFRIEEEMQTALRILTSAKGLVAHHAKFDAHMVREFMRRYAPHLPAIPYNRWRCTMIRAALLDEHRLAYDLDTLASEELNRHKVKTIWHALAELYGGPPTKDKQAPNLVRAPHTLVAQYANVDAELCAGLYSKQHKELAEQDLWQVHDLEFRLLPHVIAMEEGGVRVDLEYAHQLSKDLQVEIHKQQGALNQMAGFDVNVNPSNSLKKLIDAKRNLEGRWVVRDGTLLENTEGGAPQIDAAALRRLRMPEAALVLGLRQLRRTKETFIDGHVLSHHHDGYIHATINQTKNDVDAGTGTGRFSIQDPALQQIMKRNKKLARMVRPCFLPDPGQRWGCRDWAQMDFRIGAHYCQSPAILEAYRQNPSLDYHGMVAEFTGLRRDRDGVSGGANAKQINLGLLFGMQPGRMAQEMGLPYDRVTTSRGREWLRPGEAALAVFDRYHAAIPGVKETLDTASSIAQQRGHVLTMMGRRIRFPKGLSTHKAGGLVFQGTAADALKLKMCEVCDYLEEQDARLMLVVHDEFDISLPPNNPVIRERLREIIDGFEDGPIQFRVPIRSDYGEGANWAEASL
jgi:DNA polymerase I-like protein with 3'-5' exonuclease and polymerase domains